MQKLRTIATKKLVENLKELQKRMKMTQFHQKISIRKFICNCKRAISQNKKSKKTHTKEIKKREKFFFHEIQLERTTLHDLVQNFPPHSFVDKTKENNRIIINFFKHIEAIR